MRNWPGAGCEYLGLEQHKKRATEEDDIKNLVLLELRLVSYSLYIRI